MNKLIRKSLIFTIVALVLGIVMLIINPWPGCLISIAMLLFAVITGAFGIIIQTMDMEDYIQEKGEEKAASMINHILNIILIWGFFFFVLGIVCLFISWWAVLIAEAVCFIGMLAMLVWAWKHSIIFNALYCIPCRNKKNLVKYSGNLKAKETIERGGFNLNG